MKINKLTMKGLLYFLLPLMMGFWGCAVLSPSSSPVKYGEDLSSYRPKVPADTLAATSNPTENPSAVNITPHNHDTNAVDGKLYAINQQSKSEQTIPGFTIQVYSGTSRDQASQAKAKVYRIIPDSRPETKYEQPIYKVRVGDFGDRLEAQTVYAKLLQEFPDAIVIPSKIRIN